MQRAERRSGNSKFQALVEQSLAGIYIIQQGKLCYINPCFAHLFGYDSPGALLGVGTLQALASPEDSDRVAELVAWLASDRAAYVSGAFYPVEAAEPVPA